MAESDFLKLEVYKLAEALADGVWDVVMEWDTFARQALGIQLVRAADSVGANIAEGRGRRDVADNKRFVRVSWGSLNETQHFLRRAYKRKLVSKQAIEKLKPIVEQLGPKLNAYHASLKKR